MTSAFSWKTLLAFCLLHSVLQAQFASYSRCFLTSYFCVPFPYDEKTSVFGVSSKRSCRSSYFSYEASTSASSAILIRA